MGGQTVDGGGVQLRLDLGGLGGAAVAPEPPLPEAQEEVVRLVEYTPCPRVHPGQERRVGFTRAFSETGLCLGVDRPEPVGSMLRIVVRGVDGRPSLDSVARVAWSRSNSDGSAWIGLEFLLAVRRSAALARPGPRWIHAEVA